MGRIFSGIQPSGEITIGNYCGAIRNWVALLEEHDSIFCVVDLHAITVIYEPSEMREKILAAASVNIAAGLDPEKCTLFVQSEVPEHTELSWYFMTVTPMGDLARMTQFKEKSRRHRENVNVGLFGYPVLQAADILLYKADLIPVGEDQVQHIELSRDVARKFNARYGDVFPEPQAKLSPTPRIMGLDGKTKMSKSMDNYIGLVEEPESIRAKLAKAMTDENRKRRSDPGNPDICNIFTLHKVFSPRENVETVNEECRRAGIGCVDCKKLLADNMLKELDPIRERYHYLREHPDDVRDALRTGAERCRAIARETMDEVRRVMGLR
ncbi:MAG: tryptophan--tRNA ligase [Candidatus Eisenbacteria bacterium]|nr:tryptophan--tRNA ligase [Candidatus Eisenbacteria bacterium]